MDGSAGSYWELRFDEQGGIAAGGEDAATLVAQIRDSGTQDLFVMSHGWGNSEAAADQLYNAMFNLIRSSPGVPSIGAVPRGLLAVAVVPRRPGGAAA